MSIKIDLNDLTQAHWDACIAKIGDQCRYAAPCIIGTLIPEDRREDLDDGELTQGNSSIGVLISEQLVSISDGQDYDARHMQTAFDCGQTSDLADLVRKYVPDLKVSE